MKFPTNYPCPECGNKEFEYEEVKWNTYDVSRQQCTKCRAIFPSGMFQYRCWFDYVQPGASHEGWAVYGYIDGMRIYIGHASKKVNADAWANEWKDAQIKEQPALKGMRHWPGDQMFRIRSTEIATGKYEDSKGVFIKEEALGIINSRHKARKAKRRPVTYNYELIFIGTLNGKGEIE